MINFAYVILYVKDVPRSIKFYEELFDFAPKFIHESNEYAELDTGQTTLAFASENLAHANLPKGYIPHDLSKKPLAAEIVFTTPDVHKLFEKAIKNGASEITIPQQKPWGQEVAYVRDPNGVLIEIATPLS